MRTMSCVNCCSCSASASASDLRRWCCVRAGGVVFGSDVLAFRCPRRRPKQRPHLECLRWLNRYLDLILLQLLLQILTLPIRQILMLSLASLELPLLLYYLNYYY